MHDVDPSNAHCPSAQGNGWLDGVEQKWPAGQRSQDVPSEFGIVPGLQAEGALLFDSHIWPLVVFGHELQVATGELT